MTGYPAVSSKMRAFIATSVRQERGHCALMIVQFGARPATGNFTALEDEIPVGEPRGEPIVLLGKQHGEADRAQCADDLDQLIEDHGGQTLGRLVEQQHRRPSCQRNRYRKHLLLAATEQRSRLP